MDCYSLSTKLNIIKKRRQSINREPIVDFKFAGLACLPLLCLDSIINSLYTLESTSIVRFKFQLFF